MTSLPISASEPTRLALYSPSDQIGERTMSPPPESTSPTLESWEEQTLSKVAARVVPSEIADQYAAATTLPQFYADCMSQSARWDRIGRKTRKETTASKDKAALRHWVNATRPSDWKSSDDWRGPSLAFVSKAGIDWLEETLDRFTTVCGLSRSSVNGLGTSIRTMLNHAVKIGAIPRVQKMPRVKEGRKLATIYSPDQIEWIVDRLLAESTEYANSLATAFVLACRVGARAQDLFGLKIEDFSRDVRGRVTVRLHAAKNSEYEHKAQSIPISPTMWKIVERHCPASGLLFPLLTTKHANCIRPERSYAAQRRTEFLKKVLAEIDLEFRCPWHACRATCNETLESIKPGVGPFVLGHATAGVNARSYRNPTEDVFATIYAVPVLRCEARLAGLLADASDSYSGCG